MVWGSTFPTYLLKLASIQNKPVKLIDEGHVLESSIQFYAKLKILKLLDLYKFKTAKLVHDYMNRKLPLSFSGYFNKSCDVSNCSTRTSENPYNLYKPLFHNNRMQRSIKYQDVKIWNSLPQSIEKLPKTSFKIKLKSFLLQSYNSTNF